MQAYQKTRGQGLSNMCNDHAMPLVKLHPRSLIHYYYKYIASTLQSIQVCAHQKNVFIKV